MRVVWAESAQRDFVDAIVYLAARSPAAADRIGERILSVVSLLEDFPEIAQESRHRGLRQLVVLRTPYVVVYRVHGGQVEIRAVIHAKRKRRR